jgi:hypothetical protein
LIETSFQSRKEHAALEGGEAEEHGRFCGPSGRHAREEPARVNLTPTFACQAITYASGVTPGHSRLSRPVRAATTAVVSTQPARIDTHVHQRATPCGIQSACWPKSTTGKSTSSA